MISEVENAKILTGAMSVWQAELAATASLDESREEQFE